MGAGVRAFVHQLRTLVMGETWTLPIGLALSVAALVATRELILPDGLWADMAGGLTLGCAVAVLWACVRPN